MNNPLDPTLRELNDCGCCAGTTAETPAAIENRPGLDALDFRAGRHPQFKATMLAALTAANSPALRNLKTRDNDDLTIALLDGWATVADVLSFYSERIANESFLRTATERRSILELARSIGYELNPGVAASTFLAFTVEDAQGAPGSANIDKGTKVQSIPGPNEKPQVFETIEPLFARKEWNKLQPKSAAFVMPYFEMTQIHLKGTTTNLKPGDPLLIVGKEREDNPGSERWDLRRVKELQTFPNPDAEKAYTVVTLDHGLGSTGPYVEPAEKEPRVYALRQRAAIFGANAPEWKTLPKEVHANFGNSKEGWPHFTIAQTSEPKIENGDQKSGLYGEYFNERMLTKRELVRIDPKIDFKWDAGPPDAKIGADTFSIRWTGFIKVPATGKYRFSARVDDGVRLWIEDELILNDWSEGAAHDVVSAKAKRLQAGARYSIKLEFFEKGSPAEIKLFWTPPAGVKELVPTSAFIPRDIETIHLDAVYPGIIAESWVVLSTPDYQEVYRVKAVAEDSPAKFALNAKSTRLSVQGENLRQKFNDRIRETIVFGQSEELPWAEAPLTAALSGNEIILDRTVEPIPPEGRTLIVQSELPLDEGGGLRAEVVTLKKTEAADANHSRLILVDALTIPHLPATTLIFGNVAFSTHGETTAEVLGSGDANQPHQRFVLKQAPLTYTPAANPSGGESTLEIWVNDVRWGEALSLFDAGPRARVYVVRIADEADGGKATVLFGDGKNGARLPTGHENVRAVYRKGIRIGPDGLLKANQLTLLMTRPLGLKSVTNPKATERAADPQLFAEARRNAPTTVLTLDRVVSLEDYEDFARNFSGVAKAMATWTWQVNSRGVFLTVAGLNGAAIAPDSGTRKDLLKSLRELGNPLVPAEVKSYLPVSFKLAGTVFVESDRVPEKVETAVKDALRAAFSFEARSFGQPVTLSQVEAVIQNVAGVAFVDLDALYMGTIGGREHYLAAQKPQDGAAIGTVAPAELLTLDETSLSALKVKTI